MATTATYPDPDTLIDRHLILLSLYWGLFWLLLAPSLGVFIPTLFNFPDYLGTSQSLTFDRLRPMHINGVIFGAFSTDMVALTSAVLEKNGVQVVIGGHTHFYQHNLVNCIRHLVIGRSGAPLYTPVAKEYTIKSAKSYNYAIGDVTPDSLRLVVYNEKGEELDRIVLTQAPDRSGEGEGERIPDSR